MVNHAVDNISHGNQMMVNSSSHEKLRLDGMSLGNQATVNSGSYCNHAIDSMSHQN